MKQVTRWIAFGSVLISSAAFSQTRLISRLATGVDPAAIAAKYQLTLIDKTGNAPFAYFGAATSSQGLAARQKMATDTQIKWTEDDAAISTLENNSQKGGTIPAVGDRNAEYTRNTNVLSQIGWSKSLAFSSGRSVVVAILDTGLSGKQSYLWNKTYFAANFVESSSTPPYDIARNQDSSRNGVPDEAVGHGTMVASVLDQVAPLTRFAIARVADSDGRSSAWRIIKGLAFAVNAKAEVANISLGSVAQVAAISDVMDWCDEKNLVVVAAIGNNGVEGAVYPARISKVICVAGLKPDNVKAPFSNWDGTADAAAPATGIVGQWYDGRMGVWSGTSFAAPMVSGAIADCLRRTGRVSNRAWRDLLKSSGESINGVNPSYKDRLGTLLDIASLNSKVASSSP